MATADQNVATPPDVFNLQLVSPSAGVNGPISFAQLPATTTVKQLKEKIRERIPMRPADEHQRIIHRGRLLKRDDETMLDLFGRETLRNGEPQTLHLVLSPSAANQEEAPATPSAQPHTSQQDTQQRPPIPAFQVPPIPSVPVTPQSFANVFQSINNEQRSQSEPARERPITDTNPTVYILSSPTGPRALLVTDISTFISARPTPTIPHIHHTHPHIHLTHPSPIPTPNQHPPAHQAPHLHPHEHPQLHPYPQIPQAQPRAPLNAHGANPAAPGAIAAQLLPHIWLIVRLLGFIWFFASGNSSWWRWIMITGLSFIFFLANTRLLEGLRAPIRRHLENLIPLGPLPGGDAAAGGQAAEGAAPGQGVARAQEPTPEQVAQRLMQQRRQEDTSWLMTQLRRAEHASLLFLASLVPGVGERHIAAREAEDAALRRREEAIEEEARTAREAAAEAENAQAEEGWTTVTDSGISEAGSSERATDGGGSEGRSEMLGTSLGGHSEGEGAKTPTGAVSEKRREERT